MEVNKINSMVKSIIKATSLESSKRRFSNHSARKTVVSKLKKANLDRSEIAKVKQNLTHRNLQSPEDYDKADEQEQCQQH